MTFTSGTRIDDDFSDDYPDDLPRGSSRWRAAAPYFGGAVACWIGATIALVTLTNTYQSMQGGDGMNGQPSVTKTTILQSLNQILTWAGAAFLVVALLILALRQHENWKRSLDPSHSAAALPADDGAFVDAVAGNHAPVVPEYAQSVWDDIPNRPER